MKLNITSTYFFVNEKKKSVTCTITGDFRVTNHNVSIDFDISKKTNSLDRNVWTYPDTINDYNYFKVVATTKCKDGDVFDIERGKKIAKQKAKIKLYKEAKKLCIEALSRLLVEMHDDINKYAVMQNIETLNYEKNVLEIEVPEKIEHIKADNTTEEYHLFEDNNNIGYINNDNHVIVLEHSRKKLLEKINNIGNIHFSLVKNLEK